MNTIETGSSSSNLIVYAMTLIGTFMTDNWYLVIMGIFGAVHVFVAIRGHKRAEELHKLKLKEYENASN